MPRRIVDPPVDQRNAREAFFVRLWEEMKYRVWVVEDDLRAKHWLPLVATSPALQDLPLGTLYQSQGGPSADRLGWDHAEAFGDGDRAKGREFLKRRRGRSLPRHPRVPAAPNPHLKTYLTELERVVTTTLRLQEVKDGRAPNWALLELHADVSQGDPPRYIEFRKHWPHTTSFHRQVRLDVSVDFHGAHIVCHRNDPLDTWFSEALGVPLAMTLADRHLAPPEVETGFNDWEELRKALHEELDRVADAIADDAKQKLEVSYKDRGMRRHRYPAKRKPPATQDDELEETEHADEVLEDIERDEIGALVAWYFSGKRPADELDRARLRAIACNQLVVQFPPPGPREFLTRKRTQIRRTKGEKRHILRPGAESAGGGCG